MMVCRYASALDKYVTGFPERFREDTRSSSGMSTATKWLHLQTSCGPVQFLEHVWQYFNKRMDMQDYGDPWLQDDDEEEQYVQVFSYYIVCRYS